MFDSHLNMPDGDHKKYCVRLKQEGFWGACFTEPVVFSAENIKKAKPLKDFEVLNGIDITFEYDTHERIAISTAGMGFDYTVNSVKTVEGESLESRGYYTLQSRNDAYSRFFEKVFDSLDAAYDYQVLGALTYPAKFAYYPSPQIEFREFQDILDAILMRTVFLNKGLEVNASTLQQLGSPMPPPSILKRFRTLGGEIVTVGACGGQGDNIRQAYSLLRDCGFSFYTVFKNGLPQMHKL